MIKVLIESPLKGDYEMNRAYACECCRDSLERGEAPIAFHILYDQPGILDDKNPKERDQGILASKAWYAVVDRVAVYLDLGISPGMSAGIEYAESLGVEVEYRTIGVP